MTKSDELAIPALYSDSNVSMSDEFQLNAASPPRGIRNPDIIEENGHHKSDPDKRYALVTGGLGYIGSHTVLELLKAGNNVIIIDNLSNSSLGVLERIKRLVSQHYASLGYQSIPSLQLYQLDYTDTSAAYSLLDQYMLPTFECVARKQKRSKITGVIHFASYKSMAESVRMPLSYYSNNVAGLIRFLEALDDYGIKTLIFSSSATVYGAVRQDIAQCIPEECCVHSEGVYGEDRQKQQSQQGFPQLTSPYGRTKWMCEAILSDLCGSDPEWTVIALRYFNPIGCDPSGLLGEDPAGIPNNLMPYVGRVLQGHIPILNVFGSDFDTKDGTGVRDFIHVSDLAVGHVHALKAAAAGRLVCSFREYNLGSGQGHSVLELVEAMQTVSGKDIPWQFAARRSGDVAVSVANPRRAELELHWRTQKTFIDACRDTYHFLLQHSNGSKVEEEEINGC